MHEPFSVKPIYPKHEVKQMIETHGMSMTSAHSARLGQQEREKIHLASLEIMERIGIDVHDGKALELLVKGGAKADFTIVTAASLCVLGATTPTMVAVPTV